jgi:signal transduction histidine kinase
VRDGEGSEPIVVLGVAPTSSGSYAWIAYVVRPPLFLNMWRFIAASLAVATLLLVGTATSSVVLVRRGAATLNAALAALASDLGSPVPRPPVPELADLADHIKTLAGALARAQKDKERLGAELAQRDRLAALGRVAAGVAHEVRNPLASIKLRVDLGRMRPDTPDQLARELASVSDEVTRLDRLVADLLVVAGRRVCSRVSTALGALVDKRAALLAPWAAERGVHIETRGSATCLLDSDAVARAVDNLVRNAVEAAPEGGAVAVEVLEDERAARVRVCDRGSGVDTARAHELFEPFFTTKPNGTGLGLALSRAIAASHGGTLRYSRQDGVTCFELSFPRASGAREGVSAGHAA